MDVQTLYQQFQQDFTDIISVIETEKEAAIPTVITDITTKLLPEMAQAVGQIQGMNATDKRTLIIQAITTGINDSFQALEALPALAGESWIDLVRLILITLIGPILDNLLAVENGTLVINPSLCSWFTNCCK